MYSLKETSPALIFDRTESRAFHEYGERQANRVGLLSLAEEFCDGVALIVVDKLAYLSYVCCVKICAEDRVLQIAAGCVDAVYDKSRVVLHGADSGSVGTQSGNSFSYSVVCNLEVFCRWFNGHYDVADFAAGFAQTVALLVLLPTCADLVFAHGDVLVGH